MSWLIGLILSTLQIELRKAGDWMRIPKRNTALVVVRTSWPLDQRNHEMNFRRTAGYGILTEESVPSLPAAR